MLFKRGPDGGRLEPIEEVVVEVRPRRFARAPPPHPTHPRGPAL